MPSYRVVSLLVVPLLLGVAAAGCLGGGDNGNGGDGSGGGGNNGGGSGGGGGGGQSRDPGRIAGTVTAPDDDVAGTHVQLSRIFESTEADAQGRYAFDEVPPGDYRLTVNKEHYEAVRLDVSVEGAEETIVDVELELRMVSGTEVPVKYHLTKNYVNVLNPLDPDVLITSAGTPLGGPEATVTNMTKNNTFPGFWDLAPEEDHLFARFDVILYRFDVDSVIPIPPEVPDLPEDPPKARLGIRYFRGNDLVENEIIQEGLTEYHETEPMLDQEPLWYYQIPNEEWEKWGGWNWQIGVVAENTTDLPMGAGVAHLIQVSALLVHQDYAEIVA